MEDDKIIELGKKNGEIFVMVEPTNFWASEQTIKDNSYMVDFDMTKEETTAAAIEEHRELVKQLRDHDLAVKVFHQPHPEAYDAVYASDTMLCFKNEDFPTGVCVICPMYWHSRRLENNPEIPKWIHDKCGYEHIIDLTYFEKEDKALEGRGTTLFDWKSRCVYAGRSNRVHEDVLAELAKRMTEISGKKYEHFLIESWDPIRKNIPFHTTCFFMILRDIVIIDWTSVKTEEQRADMKSRLTKSGYEIIEVSYDEMNNGATLIVEFHNPKTNGLGLIVAKSAKDVLTEKIWNMYNEKFSPVIIVDIEVNEIVGGASVECMFQPVAI